MNHTVFLSRMRYRQFHKIDGRHPWRAVSQDAYVDYPVRTRHGGRVFYFNFDLAKEMGLIERHHTHCLNPALSRAILDTFSLVIINEYDVEHGLRFPEADIRAHKYMATRYLQCQHPSRRGTTSGDGRSIWNGCIKHGRVTWDISSCGTGATRLSPATAIFHKFFKTGDDSDSYSCGQADLLDSVAAALMSDIFHKNGISTERTLAIIAFDDGTAIIVRASKNLLRPAHLFRMLKQNRLEDLKAAVDYYIDRQTANGAWKRCPVGKGKYAQFLRYVTESFARAAAVFEAEYVFCWLDWDGDNVLMDGAVLDYGSVRQFGLFHHEYRFDDVERMSTTITEQKNKAKYTVQTFAQIVDYLVTGKKKNIRDFSGHAMMREFETIFATTKDALIIDKLGFDEKQKRLIVGQPSLRSAVRRLRAILHYFERVQSKSGIYELEDGITADALFCVRDILRELPAHLLQNEFDMDARQFIEVIKSDYVTEKDVLLTGDRRAKIREFQHLYRRLYEGVAKRSGKSPRTVLKGMTERSALINRYERVTGDAILHAGKRLVNVSAHMRQQDVQAMFERFVAEQVLRPEHFKTMARRERRRSGKRASRVLRAMLKDVRDMRSGL
jgi:uncharacterized protein YdiU (UPF0061 family)